MIHSLARVGIPIAGESVVAGTLVFELQPSSSPRVSVKASRGVSLSGILHYIRHNIYNYTAYFRYFEEFGDLNSCNGAVRHQNTSVGL